MAGFFLLVGYNLVVRVRAVFLMNLCGSGLFRFVCALVGMIFCLVISFCVLCGTLWVEVGFGGGGACPCDVLADVFLNLIFVL